MIVGFAEQLLQQPDLKDTTVLLPNRRTQYTLQAALVAQSQQARWMPVLDTYTAWLESRVQDARLDELSLVALLWDISGRQQGLQAFYPNARQLLKVFNDVDLALAEPARAFSILMQQEAALQPANAMERAYLQLLEEAHQLYNDLNRVLDVRSQTYTGRSIRKVALQPDKYLKKLPEALYVVGLDLIPKAELRVLEYLAGKAHILWDVDQYYWRQPHHAAGRLFRALPSHLQPQQFSDAIAQKDIAVEVKSCANSTAQCIALGQDLHDRIAKGDVQQLCIILADEALLPTLLSALPDNVPSVNIGMGYPASETALHSLLRAWQQLHLQATPQGFYHRQLTVLLKHPALVAEPQAQQILNTLARENRSYLQPAAQHAFLQLLFAPMHRAEDVLFRLQDIHTYFVAHWGIGDGALQAMQRAYVELLAVQLQHVQQLLETYELLEPADVLHLVLQRMSGQRITLEHDSHAMIQVYGMLETRTLALEELYILSANEGQLPPAARPEHLLTQYSKQRLGIPTIDAVSDQYSYLFWRLLHHAKSMTLYFASAGSGLGSVEPSRFIRQLELELQPRHFKQSSSVLAVHSARPATHSLPVPPLESLKLSASGLISYLKCPYQYALRYECGLKPREEVEEHPDAAAFGTLVHAVLEELYKPWLGIALEEANFRQLKPEPVLEHCFKRHFPTAPWPLSGRAMLLYETVLAIVKRVLAADKARLPFTVQMTEGYLTHEQTIAGIPVVLHGYIDRVDERNGVIQIIDYKTGTVEHTKLNVKDISQVLEDRGSKTRYLAIQSWMYLLLYDQGKPFQGSAAIYQLKAANIGLLPQKEVADAGTLAQITQLFETLIAELTSVERRQTDDRAVCKYCDYRQLCQRDID